MRVWLIKDGEPLPLEDDSPRLRMGNLAAALLARGHDVTWWTTTFSHYDKTRIFPRDTEIRILDGVRLRALECGAYGGNISLGRLRHHRRFAERFLEAAEGEPLPDLVLAALPIPKVAGAAVEWCRRRRIPVVVDLRDKWPDIYLDQLPTALRPLGRLLLSDEFRTMRRLCTDANALTAMMQSMLDWGLTYAGRSATDRDRVFYLGGRAAGCAPGTEEIAPGMSEKLAGRFLVAYAGSFGYYNHPLDLVGAARLLAASSPDLPVSFVLAGKGRFLHEAQEKAADLSNVHFPGWLGPNAMAALTSAADVGVIPWAKGFAFPNKAFSYLASGLPIITSAEGDLADLLTRHGAGRICRPGDAADLAGVVGDLAGDRAACSAMSRAAADLFEERLDAVGIYDGFAAHLELIAGDRDS